MSHQMTRAGTTARQRCALERPEKIRGLTLVEDAVYDLAAGVDFILSQRHRTQSSVPPCVPRETNHVRIGGRVV